MGKEIDNPRYDIVYSRNYTFSNVDHIAEPIPISLFPLLEYVNGLGYGPLCCIDEIDCCNVNQLKLIKTIIDNKSGSYIVKYDNELFSIIITEKDIIISTLDVRMTLPISNLDDFIYGLQKLYNILDSYPKYG